MCTCGNDKFFLEHKQTCLHTYNVHAQRELHHAYTNKHQQVPLVAYACTRHDIFHSIGKDRSERRSCTWQMTVYVVRRQHVFKFICWRILHDLTTLHTFRPLSLSLLLFPLDEVNKWFICNTRYIIRSPHIHTQPIYSRSIDDWGSYYVSCVCCCYTFPSSRISWYLFIHSSHIDCNDGWQQFYFFSSVFHKQFVALQLYNRTTFDSKNRYRQRNI